MKRRRRRRSRSYAQPQQAGQAAQEEMRHKWPLGSSGADNDAAPASTLFVPDLEQAVSIHLLWTPAHQAGYREISNTEEKLVNILIIILQKGGQN